MMVNDIGKEYRMGDRGYKNLSGKPVMRFPFAMI
jgi:hypothetical protein